MEPSEYNNKGETVGLLICLLQPYSTSCCHVVLDSNLCVLKGVAGLQKWGFFAGALIKKCIYWSTLIPGNELDWHFSNKEVGKCNATSGVLDKERYFNWYMKKPDYLMKIATGGTLISDDSCKNVTRKWTCGGGSSMEARFHYTKSFDWNFSYCHNVENHNNLCHSLSTLEETWIQHAGQSMFLHSYLQSPKCSLILSNDFLCGKGTRTKISHTWISATILLGN